VIVRIFRVVKMYLHDVILYFPDWPQNDTKACRGKTI